MLREAVFARWVGARCTRRPYLCEKGDSKKLNAFFKDFKLALPLPDYASMQARRALRPARLRTPPLGALG